MSDILMPILHESSAIDEDTLNRIKALLNMTTILL